MGRGDAQLFGEQLRQRRKNLDLTQDQLAECAGCSPATIRLIERGQRRPSRQIADLLARCLRIPQTDLADFLALARGLTSAPDDADDGIMSQPTADEEEPATPSNLPAQLITLIGRDDEVAAIEDLLLRNDAHLVTLTGPPGVGKTSLALQVATSLAHNQLGANGVGTQFQDGVFWVPLASETQPEMAIPTIARVLDVQGLGGQPILTTLKQHLAHKRLLLVLDNFEQVIQAAPQMAELLSSCSHLKVLITSRESLHIRMEQSFNVEPLSLPDMADLPSVEDLAASPAVALFVERAQAVNLHFALTPENAPLVAAICERLDGVPLAIELVAARTRVLPLKALLARLQTVAGQSSHLDLLSSGARDLPDRHKTLRDAISWSYDLLTDDEQLLFTRLGVFLGGFTFPAVEAICNATSDLNLDLLEGISQLLDKNLLKREIVLDRDIAELEDDIDGVRFTMLETIHEYAIERLRACGEEQALRLLHVEYFLGMSASPDLYSISESTSRVYKQLDHNRDNLRAALTWTIENGRLDLASQFGVSLPRYWETKGYFAEGRDWLLRITSAQTATPDLDPDSRAKQAVMLLFAGRLSMYMCDYITMRPLLEKSRSISSDLGLDSFRDGANQHLGIAAWLQGDYATALPIVEAMLKTQEASAYKPGIATALWLLGIIAGECGDFERAEPLLNDARATGKSAGDMYTLMGSTRDLGTTLCYAGRYAEAIRLLEEALAIARSAEFEVGKAWTFSALGLATIGLGRYDIATEQLRESLVLARRRDKHRIPDSLEGLAEVELAQPRSEGNHKALSRAATLLGAAEAARRILSTKLIPARKAARERLVSEVRARLGETAYQQAYELGETMSLEETISSGLGASPEAGW